MKSKNYDEFVEKFKPKLTTDECWTPQEIKDKIADYVETKYGIEKSKHFDPFYYGGDYEHEDYTGRVVVGNPPFSILSKIVRYYMRNNIKFFLYGPTLTMFNIAPEQPIAKIFAGCSIIYENGADVNTSFMTNLEAPCVRSDPFLYSISNKPKTKNRPIRNFPENIKTAKDFVNASKRGEEIKYTDFIYTGKATDTQTGEIFRIFGAGIKV